MRVPVRPHLGVMGVAPAESGRINSIPPGPFGGNVDNWRLGAGAAMAYPVFAPGAGLYVGDPHLAQGDGELCGTAIEASLDVTLQVFVLDDLPVTAPVLATASHWFVARLRRRPRRGHAHGRRAGAVAADRSPRALP